MYAYLNHAGARLISVLHCRRGIPEGVIAEGLVGIVHVAYRDEQMGIMKIDGDLLRGAGIHD